MPDEECEDCLPEGKCERHSFLAKLPRVEDSHAFCGICKTAHAPDIRCMMTPQRVEDAIADHVDNPNAQRVEDSHAKLAAEMREQYPWSPVVQAFAARVEAMEKRMREVADDVAALHESIYDGHPEWPDVMGALLDMRAKLLEGLGAE